MKNEPLPPKLAFACPKRWHEMRKDGPQQRFCDQCQLHVHDLSALTERQGQRVLAEADGKLCVSFLVRPDGKMVTRTRWDGLKRGWLGLRQGVLTLLAMVTPFALVSCTGGDRSRSTATLGKVCVATPNDGSSGRLVGEAPPMRTAGAPLPVKRQGADR